MEDKKFRVRLFDYYDGWIDVSAELSREEAEKLWNKETKNGTQNVEYKRCGSYYRIFPADTKMMYTPESLGR